MSKMVPISSEVIIWIVALIFMTMLVFAVAMQNGTKELIQSGEATITKAERLNAETKRLLEEGCK